MQSNNRNSDIINSTPRHLPHIRLSLPSASSTPDLLFIPASPVSSNRSLPATSEEGDIGDHGQEPVSPTFTLSSTLPRSNTVASLYGRRSSGSELPPKTEPLLSVAFTPSSIATSHNPFSDVDVITDTFLASASVTDHGMHDASVASATNGTLSDVLPRGSMESSYSDLADERRRRRTSRDVMESLALDRFRKWMVCFCIVNFDLELGQAMDFVYPPVEFTEQEKKNICFSAFPDSNVFEVGDTVYNFRIRSNSKSGFAASGPTADAGFLYGYVFFRQKKDPRIRRGYFQKSIVLVSQHPYVGLFSRLISILGPAFCDVGKPMLEAACHNIASWKMPLPGQYFELPFLGSVIQVEIPQPHKPQLLETSPFDMDRLRLETQILASVPTGTLYSHFKGMLEDLWLCWELMLLAEPLVVMAPDPSVCSEAVVTLVDIINPIPYCGDYRPYFTIQDSDFKSFVTKNQPPSNLVLGVTNPFFNTALEHWPTVIRVGNAKPRKPDGSLILHKTKGGKTANFLDFVKGVTSKRKSVITKDRALLKMFAEAAVRDVPAPHVLNNILRRHFVDLTEKFLVPLNRYFSTLIPVNMSLSGKQQPQLKPFSTDSFMKSLKEHGPQLPFKSAFSTRASATDVTKELYSHFLKCGNFATWLRLRTQEAQRELHKKYVQMLCDSDMREWMRGRHEVELVDLLLKVKHELRQGSDTADLSSSSTTFLSAAMSASSSTSTLAEDRPTTKQLELLHAQADVIIMGLPKDLRESFSLGNGGNGA